MNIKIKKLLEACAESGDYSAFYGTYDWKTTAAKVRKMDRNECQECKRHGRYSRGYIVHHIKHLQTRPDLALDVYDPDSGERQLETICKACHEKMHPEALGREPKQPEKTVTVEWWD